MNEAQIITTKQVKLKNPVLIEGLPGLGLVGRIACDHLIKQLKAEKFAELYSPDFPPQVIIQPDATIRMRKNEFYYYKAKSKKQQDMIILIGDDQGLTIQAQYAICGKILDFAETHGAKTVYTLGGYGLQKLAKEPRVFGAVTDKKMVSEFKKHGVIFQKVGGAIVGAAGLLLGLGQIRKMKGICLMGETHGNYVDPKAAKNVLKIVADSLGLKINLTELDEKAKETEEMIKKLEQVQKPQMAGMPSEKPLDEKTPLSYIR